LLKKLYKNIQFLLLFKIQFEWSKMTFQFLKQLGFSDIDFKTYNGMGHTTSDEELSDIKAFLLAFK
jgi:hypothetical protein